MAKEIENQNGKTEMWYVVEADDDAGIIGAALLWKDSQF
jgi:hypothetical protein